LKNGNFALLPFCVLAIKLTPVKKQRVIEAIIERLKQDLGLYYKAALASRAEATHEQSKAENKYDTRGLEASYLARGQSKQVAELELAIDKFAALPVRDFTAADPIDTGALVELSSKTETNIYFIGPKAGGTEVVCGKKEILVITPESPLGSQLIGKKQGEACQLTLPGRKEKLTITSVR